MSQTITITLDAFIHLALDEGRVYNRPLPDYDTALIVHQLTKDKLIHKVQFEDFDGSPLSQPKLWAYNEWVQSRDAFLRGKDRSEKERVQRFIRDANVKIISRHLINEYFYDPDKAEAVAYGLIQGKKKGAIRALGINKLVTKEEELK